MGLAASEEMVAPNHNQYRYLWRVGRRHLNATTENKVLFSEIDAQRRFSKLKIVAGNKRK